MTTSVLITVASEDVVALEIPILYNKYGDVDPNGLMFALEGSARRVRGFLPVSPSHVLQKTNGNSFPIGKASPARSRPSSLQNYSSEGSSS